MKKKKKRRSRFYPVFLTVVALLAALIPVSMAVLSDVFAYYESTLPKYVAREAFARYEAGDFEALCARDENPLSRGADPAAYAAYLNAYVAGRELTLNERRSPDADAMNYTVDAEGERIAELRVVKQAETGRYGFDLWKLGGEKTLILTEKRYRATVPSDATLYADGRALAPSDVAEKTEARLTEAALPEGAVFPTLSTYEISTCFAEPVFTATDASGAPLALEPDESGTPAAPIVYDEALQKAYGKNMMAMATKYAKFASGHTDRARMLKSIVEGTDAYSRVESYSTMFFPQHSDYKIEKMSTSNYYSYGEDCFGCRVQFLFKLKSKVDRRWRSYPTYYDFVMTRRGSGWAIYDLAIS